MPENKEQFDYEKRLIFISFIVDLVKYSALFFIVPYALMWAYSTILVSPEMYDMCVKLVN